MRRKGCILSVPALAALCLLAAIAISAAPGDLDPTFGSGGKLTGRSGTATGAVIQLDGKIVGIADDFSVARYNSDGSQDITFGESGLVSTYFGSEGGGAFDIKIQSDGKIVVGGYACPCDDWGAASFALVRYNRDGSLDLSFDGDGKVTTTIGARSTGYSVAIQPDNKIVVAGSLWEFGVGFGGDFALARYNPDGSLDTTFGGDGKVQTGICCNDEINSVAVQPDGKIVAVGGGFDGTTNTRFFVVRYNVDGSLDGTFGQLQTPFGVGQYASAVRIQGDGKIVVGGVSWTGTSWGSSSHIALARYNSNGSLDATFDNDGKVTSQIVADAGWRSSLAIQPDGKIVAASTSNNGSNDDFALVRYLPNGSLDTTFGGGDGETTVDFSNSSDAAWSIALDGAGRAVVVGSSDGRMAAARFLLQPQVSVSGRVTSPSGQGLRNAEVSLTDQFGVVRTTITSSFGFYSFDNIQAGPTYTISVSSRRYRFTARTLIINENLTDIDLVGQE